MQVQLVHGKSEFIISYILSLALNYHPNDVSFVLIDYKGGGLTGAFKNGDMELPHIVGSITNIDTDGLQRSLVSIKSEVKRRQILFNKAREIANNGTIDIYKYQKLYHQGILSEPLPHLLIICDEFAELKQQQPDFMAELVSISRIGRSLGVHLILATQKPSGIVDEQIRSNSKFAICLKVQDRTDSNDVIGTDKAAFLKQAGRFYLKVGNDEYFMLGQSGWAGSPYTPDSNKINKEERVIQFISNTGKIIKEVSDGIKVKAKSEGEQLTHVVKNICEIAKEENFVPRKLWLEKLSDNIYIDELKKKYNYKELENDNNIVIGEYDDPEKQHQDLVKLDIVNSGNIAIFGTVDSGKETLLNTIINELITKYSSNKLWIYILDFGSETFKIWKDAPHVGDVILSDNNEKIVRFFKVIKEEMDERKEILSDYNGNYDYYIKTSKKDMPVIVTFINGFENFSEKYIDDYDDLLLSIVREGQKYGIVFVFIASSTNDFRYRLLQTIKRKICLSLTDEMNYMDVFDITARKKLPHIFGRGFIEINEEILEFQTAKICRPENYNIEIKTRIDKVKEKNQLIANEIKILPNIVKLTDFNSDEISIANFPIGITNKDLQELYYDFEKNFVTVLTGRLIEDAGIYAENLERSISNIKNVKTVVLDFEKLMSNTGKTPNETYEEFCKSIDKTSKNKEHTIVVICGVEKLLNSPENDENNFGDIISKCKKKGNYSFIIAESEQKIKDYSYENWYKDITSNNIIWIGDGISEQYILEVHASNKEVIENCGKTFGYIGVKNKTVMFKLLGMKEEEQING